MASTYLSRTVSSASNRKTWTYSAWIKRSGGIGNTQTLLVSWTDGNNHSKIRLEGDKVHVYDLTSGSFSYQVKTNRLLRDTNAWYHLVVAFDTTQGTASNRLKIYINGEQETSLADSSYPAQEYEGFINRNRVHSIGYNANNSNYFDGSMSHVNLVDGTALTPSAFGSTDSTTGEWKINTSPSVTYGTNGFFILKDGNSVTDQSGNSNNFTVGAGTLTKTEDCPSNVFATLNPLVYSSASKTYGHGNNSITASDSGNWCSTQSTIGASSGKYYCEIKINSVGSYQAIGVAYQPNVSNTTSTQLIGELTGSAGWRNNGALVHGGSNINTYTTGDILMIAMDLDNQKLYFGKNGTWENSGVPTSGSTGTGSLKDLTANEFYHFVICPRGGSNYCNFGNGYFGTTAVSSAGTNASGIGIFEYDVPTGYTALSTKGLNL